MYHDACVASRFLVSAEIASHAALGKSRRKGEKRAERPKGWGEGLGLGRNCIFSYFEKPLKFVVFVGVVVSLEFGVELHATTLPVQMQSEWPSIVFHDKVCNSAVLSEISSQSRLMNPLSVMLSPRFSNTKLLLGIQLNLSKLYENS